MRYKEPFSLFSRKLPSGNTVFYYYTYDDQGERTIARSTGKTTKSAAKKVCMELWKANKLIPKAETKLPTLGEYGVSVWDFRYSTFIRYKELRGFKISISHAQNQGNLFKKHVIPVLGDKPLDKVTPLMIENWFLGLKEAGYSHQTCNHMLSNIRTVLGEAHRQGMIPFNPADTVKPVSKESKQRGILAEEEVKLLLNPETAKTMWPTGVVYIAQMLAATTGLRMGEIQALRWQDLFPKDNPDRITVKHSWDRRYGLKETKTKKERIVPLPGMLRGFLMNLTTRRDPDKFIFSYDQGESPINDRVLLRSLYEAFQKIGITEKARQERDLTFHGWRHFFNTFLKRSGVDQSKVKLVTGHSTDQMTERYTHFDINDLKEVVEAQKDIIEIAKS